MFSKVDTLIRRTKGKKYRSRGHQKDPRGQIKNAVSIDERSRIGDWEIDTVIGKNHKQALVTIVERKSKFTVMKKLSNNASQINSPLKMLFR